MIGVCNTEVSIENSYENSGYSYGRLHIKSLEFRSAWGISVLEI